MEIYVTQIKPIPGSQFSEVSKKAFNVYDKIRKKSKRRPYVRSAYFNKQKIFLPLFWSHLHEKWNHRDKTRRAKYFPCAIDLIENSKRHPATTQSLENPSELLHRFTGKTKDGQIFFVQIKEKISSEEKYLISAFPE